MAKSKSRFIPSAISRLLQIHACRALPRDSVVADPRVTQTPRPPSVLEYVNPHFDSGVSPPCAQCFRRSNDQLRANFVRKNEWVKKVVAIFSIHPQKRDYLSLTFHKKTSGVSFPESPRKDVRRHVVNHSVGGSQKAAVGASPNTLIPHEPTAVGPFLA